MISFLKKNWFFLAVITVALLGYLFPRASQVISPHLGILVGMMMFMLGLGIGWRRFLSRTAMVKELFLSLGITYLLGPILFLLTGYFFFRGQPDAYLGLILIGTTCTTLSSCVIYTRLSGGDEALALWMSVVSSVSCSFLMPLLLGIMPIKHSFVPPVMEMILRLSKVLLLPLAAGMLTRFLVGEKRLARTGHFFTDSCMFIILTVIFVSVGEGRPLIEQGAVFYNLMMACLGLHLLLIAVSATAAKVFRLELVKRPALAFCASQKTIQFPVYLSVVVLARPQASLPAVIFHVIQLLFGSLVISYFKRKISASADRERLCTK